MRSQSTRHIFMIEPACFYANPETMDTNVYQVKDGAQENPEAIFKSALREFRAFRDELIGQGVIVTTALGYEACPDMVFPNWMSTHQDGQFFLYPMRNTNRRAERAPEVIEAFKAAYPDFIDWSDFEAREMFLESTASIVSDHVNKVGYSGLSARTNRELVEKWGALMGYEMEIFETRSHQGLPVYHTDFLMYIGSAMAGLCSPCIEDKDRARVLERLSASHDVVEFTMEQLQANCGNALEVIGTGAEKMLVMSDAAFGALSPAQLKAMQAHYKTIIHSDLKTLERYGGGSARCMLMEIFPSVS